MNSKIWSNLSKKYGADKAIAVLTAVGMVFSTVVLPVPLIAADNTETFNSSDTFTVPTDVTEITIEAWGAGGGGGNENGGAHQGGGGGGGYAKATISVSPDDEIDIIVGEGGEPGQDGGNSFINEGSEILAEGGKTGTRGGGTGGGGTGDVVHNGGNGADRGGSAGGGGGGSAFDNGNGEDGENGENADGGAGGNGEGIGGNGGDNGESGENGINPGGGGGGRGNGPASDDSRVSGSGADGLVIISWDDPVVVPNDPTDADLSITKSVSTSTVAVGDQFTYTIEVTNNGPATSTEITVTDTLNSCLDFVSANPDEYSNDEWAVNDLGNGDSASLEITVELNDSCQVDDEIENTASVASDEDLNSENDSASTTITVIEASGNGGGDPQDPVSQITAPTENEVVSGTTTLEAFYVDENEDGDDEVKWAVRAGTCEAGIGTVFGNVDGHTDVANWDGANFDVDFDTTSVDDGDYCFVFNPTEDGGASEDVRLTRDFVIQNVVVVDPIVATILGFKWHDLNFDGLWTTLIEEDTELEIEAEYEPVLEGWTIKATPIEGDGGVATTTTHGEEKSTTTDSDGKYEFGFTADEFGWWRISEESQAGWVQTSTTTPNFDIEINTEGEIAGEIGDEHLNFGNYELLVISNESVENAEETQATITWDTNNPGTSRVVYGTTSQTELGDAPNYGYASSTDIADEDPKVLNHSVLIEGLTPGITYFYRVISSASPEAVGGENSFVAFQQSSGGGGGGSSSSGGSSGGGGGSSSSSGGSSNSGGGTANTGGSTETPPVILYEIMPPEYYENPETFGQLPTEEPAVVALGEQVAEEVDETGGISTTTDEEGDVVVTNIDEDDTGLLAATIFGIPEGIAKTLFWIVLLLILAYIIYKAWQKYKERKEQQV